MLTALYIGLGWLALSVFTIVGTAGMILMAYDQPWHTLGVGGKAFRVVLSAVLLPVMLILLAVQLIIERD